MAREVLHNRDQAFSSRSVPDAVRINGYHEVSIAWLPVSPLWRKLRKIYAFHLFSPRKMELNESLRIEKLKELVSYVHQRCGAPVDIGQAAFMTSLNLIWNMLFSIDVIDSVVGYSNFRGVVWGVVKEAGRPNLSDFFPAMAGLDLQGRRRRVGKLSKNMDGVFEEFIAQRLKSSTTYNDFLDWLIKCQHEEDGLELHGGIVKSFLKDIFIAGSESTSSTVVWAMAELLRNPRSMAKARSELIDAIGDGNEIEEPIILHLRYLKAVVKETLRLHPPLPFLLPRRAETDIELNGYIIPKHSQVLVNVWAMGRDHRVWDDPDKFLPERFLDKDVNFNGGNFELIPFGAGRRICPALGMGSRMVHLMLASLLYPFEWKVPDGVHVDMKEKFGLTLAKAVPLRAVPI
nr:cytochrome P450 [Paris polyphylla]